MSKIFGRGWCFFVSGALFVLKAEINCTKMNVNDFFGGRNKYIRSKWDKKVTQANCFPVAGTESQNDTS